MKFLNRFHFWAGIAGIDGVGNIRIMYGKITTKTKQLYTVKVWNGF